MTATIARPQAQHRFLDQVISFFNSSDEIPDLYSYRVSDPLFPSSQTRFYQVLLAIAGRRVVVCPKMRLADLIHIPKTYPQYKQLYRRIAWRSVDFVLCERYTLKPLLAIELYDHNLPRATRKKRDPFIDKVFRAAKLPILHLVAQPEYSLKALALRIAPYLTMVVYSRNSEPIDLAAPPRCPCCHTPMVKRRVISGQYAGREYYSCRNYPNCCERVPLTKAMAYVN